MGKIDDPINNSKGCGGVMRIAPIGLLVNKDRVFDMACECAAITHGHPSGFIAAGACAFIIHNIIEGLSILESIENALVALQTKKYSNECISLIEYAIELAESNCSHSDAIVQLGQGWVAEEALAIAIYCSLVAQDNFMKGLTLAVNHSGDSDSTGAITGNILGAYLGINSIPSNWINNVELAKELIELADDLLVGFVDTKEWWDKYPGW